MENPNIWLTRRASGVLAHLSSLPSRFGIGNMGEGARKFIDFLHEHKFSYWQICPVGPTGYGDSPYQSFSSFAGNPYFIDLEDLIEKGFVDEEWVEPLTNLPEQEVAYGEVYKLFWNILSLASDRFFENPSPLGFQTYEEFIEAEADWLEPYVLFMALKLANGGIPWHQWSIELRNWESAKEQSHSDDILAEANRQRFYQYCFYQQWHELRCAAHEKEIQIIGDLPIYVSYDSADCWQDPELFMLDGEGRQITVSGVPPDYFSEFGQLWGNPLYDWELHQKTGFDWWLNRVGRSFRIYDVIRLDHFRGFDSYWAVKSGASDARVGEWLRAPGEEFFKAINSKIPLAKLIAEDLGYITEDVYKLRTSFGLPGMKILQFGFGHDRNQVNLPHCFERNSVVYTGTHDNDTTRGWLASSSGEQKQRVRSYFKTESSHSAWPMIQAAFATVSNLAVVPLQDLLDLSSWARFNTPGTASGNWKWRFTQEQLDRMIERRGEQIRYWQDLYCRTGEDANLEFSESPEH